MGEEDNILFPVFYDIIWFWVSDSMFDYKTILNKAGKLDATKTKGAPILDGFPDVPTSAYCVLNNKEPKRCLHCGKILPVLSFSKGWKDNQIACSKECLSKLNHLVKERREKTMIERYGVSNASLSPELVEKRKETNIKRFGHETPLSNSLVRDKIKKTNLIRYGTESPLSSEKVKEKIRATNIERYGHENPASCPSVRERITNTKRIKYNWKDHSDPKPKYLLPYRKFLGHENMILLNDKDRLIREYEKKGSFALAEEMGCNYQLILSYLKKHGYEFKKSPVSFLEKKIIHFLDEEGIEYIQHDREVLDGKEIDILIPQFKLGIEVHGNYFHSYSPVATIKGIEDKYYSRDKFLLAKEKGISLLQLREDQIREKFEIVKSIIKVKIGKADRIFARKTRIVELDVETARKFCEESHISGYAPSSIRLGLEHDNKLVSVMTFGKMRFSKQREEYELVRFCTSKNTVVVGGGSKLLKHFIEKYSRNIITYSDCMVGDGDSYLKMGFEFSHMTDPGYFWVSPSGEVQSRMKYQRHKLESIFNEKYPESETEDSIMFANGFRKLYNAGNNKFILK